MELADLAKHTIRWLAPEAPESDVVISSRIRLARNLAEYPFTTKAGEQEKLEIVEMEDAWEADPESDSFCASYINF